MMEIVDKKQFYSRQIAESRDRIHTYKRRGNGWLALKLFCFILSSFCVWQGFSVGWEIYGYVAAVCAILFLVFYQFDVKNLHRQEKEKRFLHVCESEEKALNGDYSVFRSGEEYVDTRHPYTYDLDIFGKKSFFQRTNRTVTKEGSDRLAALLSEFSTTIDKIEERRGAITELAAKGEWLLHFIALPYLDNDRLRRLSHFLESRELTAIRSFWGLKQLIALVSVLLTVSALLGGFAGVLPWTFFSLLFLFQLLWTFTEAKNSKAMLQQSEGLKKSVNAYMGQLQLWKTCGKTNSRLLEDYRQLCQKEPEGILSSFKQLARLVNCINCRSTDVGFILFNGLFLFDLFLLRSFVIWRQRTLRSMDCWLDFLADGDALVSMALYRFNNPRNTDALIVEDGEFVVEATAIYHPFLPMERAVGNDFSIRNGDMAIVTGANMAGKSTFLRTLGINYVMAMNGLPVCASHLRIRFMSLFSSMRTSDDLSSDISYFHAELLRLEQLISYCKEHPHTLIILDEILKGTNSEDKLKGSRLFLQKIMQLPVTGIIATHDLKLSELEKEVTGRFHNYCFEIALENNISYSYKIKRGTARNMNATFLLTEILNRIDYCEE